MSSHTKEIDPEVIYKRTSATIDYLLFYKHTKKDKIKVMETNFWTFRPPKCSWSSRPQYQHTNLRILCHRHTRRHRFLLLLANINHDNIWRDILSESVFGKRSHPCENNNNKVKTNKHTVPLWFFGKSLLFFVHCDVFASWLRLPSSRITALFSLLPLPAHFYFLFFFISTWFFCVCCWKGDGGPTG